MLDLQKTDAIFVFGKNLSPLRGIQELMMTPGHISPLSLVNAIAMEKIVRLGYKGPIAFLTGPTAGDDFPHEGAAIQKAFLSRFEERPTNPLFLIGHSLHTGEDVKLALDFMRVHEFKSPGFLSVGGHFHAIEKNLPRNHSVSFLPAEEYLSQEELRQVSDGKVIFERLIEDTLGRMVPNRMRKFLAERQRPGMRK